ncbi:MAG: UDP-N-acetylglucosamine 1-carboxyvinyltransferase [Bacteroidota bacterium]
MSGMKTEAYRINGGKPVIGEINCLGAKNLSTKAMVAAMMGDSPTTLSNVPPIGDVDITAEMLTSIGMKIVKGTKDSLRLDPSSMNTSDVPMPQTGSNRIPILLLGPLLHLYGKASIPVLGGCKIGARNVDFHIMAVRQFGGIVDQTDKGYVAGLKKKLKGTQITLPYPSVGATETCLFLGVLAEGRTVISNAAIEPEIFQLITMLRSMGAIIFTSPGRDIIIDGVKKLHGTNLQILGDRIEAASWAALACASKGDITVNGIRPDILGNFLSYFRQVGGGFELTGENSIHFYRREELKPTVIETDVYPGFSTDWQQPFAILLTQAAGISVIHETVYENRFGYLKTLNKLGARTQPTTHCLGSIQCRYKERGYEHSVLITGPSPLVATSEPIEIPDLRAGLAYIIAAAIAKGTSVITGVPYIERGYGDIVPRLAAMNLDIKKVEI